MIIKTFIEPPIDNNNYLVIDEDSGEAVLIDCSSLDVNDSVAAALKEYNATLKYLLLTHGHFDHIAGIRQHKNNLQYELLMHENDLKILNDSNKYLPMFGMPEITIPKPDKYVKDNDILYIGKTEIKVLHTPGHTQGGVCYYVKDKLFTGDTIFRGSVGRCDLEGGDFNQLVESIKTKIYTLPDETEIFPGHGASSVVSWEKLYNKFL